MKGVTWWRPFCTLSDRTTITGTDRSNDGKRFNHNLAECIARFTRYTNQFKLSITMKFLWILAILASFAFADDSSSGSSSSSSSSSSSNKKASGTNLFADSESTYYDGYQQAWRYLGWYVKCGSPSDRYSNQQHHSHSGDSSASEESVNHYCQRYLIWAAVRWESIKAEYLFIFKILIWCASFNLLFYFSVRGWELSRWWYWRVFVLQPVKASLGQFRMSGAW